MRRIYRTNNFSKKLSKMSGGTFEYSQSRIRDIYEEIQRRLNNMGKEKTEGDEEYYGKEYNEKYPEHKYHKVESDEVKKIFSEGIEILKKAEIYAQRIDWYLAGDDGEETLISELKEELKKLERNKNKLSE